MQLYNYVITRMITDRIGLHSVLLPLQIAIISGEATPHANISISKLLAIG